VAAAWSGRALVSTGEREGLFSLPAAWAGLGLGLGLGLEAQTQQQQQQQQQQKRTQTQTQAGEFLDGGGECWFADLSPSWDWRRADGNALVAAAVGGGALLSAQDVNWDGDGAAFLFSTPRPRRLLQSCFAIQDLFHLEPDRASKCLEAQRLIRGNWRAPAANTAPALGGEKGNEQRATSYELQPAPQQAWLLEWTRRRYQATASGHSIKYITA
jgi:hypothetical protein